MAKVLKGKAIKSVEHNGARSKILRKFAAAKGDYLGYGALQRHMKKQGDDSTIPSKERDEITTKHMKATGGHSHYGQQRTDRMCKRMDEAEKEFQGAEKIDSLRSALDSVPKMLRAYGLPRYAEQIDKRAKSFKPVTVPPPSANASSKPKTPRKAN